MEISFGMRTKNARIIMLRIFSNFIWSGFYSVSAILFPIHLLRGCVPGWTFLLL